MENLKALLSVRFESTYGSEELSQLFHQRLEDFRNVPGLIQKYYAADENTGIVGGIYVFENKDARAAFWNSKLAQDIPATYGVKIETLRVEELDILIELMESVAA
ncbi:MAG: YdhR family protein [Ferruginibacter sp.]